MPAQVNITVESDADFYQAFQYTLADGLTPISITSWTFKYGVRRAVADAATLFSVTSTQSNSGQITLFDAPNGKFTLWIAQLQLLRLPPGTFAHALIGYAPAQTGIPALANPIFGGYLTINQGAAR